MNTSALESLASASRERLIEMSVATIERKMADPLLSDADRARLTQAVDKHAEAGGWVPRRWSPTRGSTA